MDYYRYLNRVTRAAFKAWIKREPYRETSWTPRAQLLGRPSRSLAQSKVRGDARAERLDGTQDHQGIEAAYPGEEDESLFA